MEISPFQATKNPLYVHADVVMCLEDRLREKYALWGRCQPRTFVFFRDTLLESQSYLKMSIRSSFDLKKADELTGSTSGESQKEAYRSPIWQTAIDRYYEELRKGGVKGPTIDHDVWSVHSPDDLLQQMNNLAPGNQCISSQWVDNLRRLEPILLNLNDFAAVITLALGMKSQVAAIIWGSIRLILKV